MLAKIYGFVIVVFGLWGLSIWLDDSLRGIPSGFWIGAMLLGLIEFLRRTILRDFQEHFGVGEDADPNSVLTLDDRLDAFEDSRGHDG